MEERRQRVRAEQRGRREPIRAERRRAVLADLVGRRRVERPHLAEQALELRPHHVGRDRRRRVVAPARRPAPSPVARRAVRGGEQLPALVDVVAAWRPQGVDPLDGGPDELARLIASELKRWGDVATAAGLKK